MAPLVGLLPTTAPGAYLGPAGPNMVIYGGSIVTTINGAEIDNEPQPCPSIKNGGVWAFPSLKASSPTPTTWIIVQVVNVTQYNALVQAFAFEMVEVRSFQFDLHRFKPSD